MSGQKHPVHGAAHGAAGHGNASQRGRAMATRRRTLSRRDLRMERPIAALQRRWGPPVVIILIALIVLICDPQSILWVLAAVVIAFIALSIVRRRSREGPTYRG